MTTEEEAGILPEEASGLELEAPSEAESLGSVLDTFSPPLTISGLAESGKLMREPSARKMTATSAANVSSVNRVKASTTLEAEKREAALSMPAVHKPTQP